MSHDHGGMPTTPGSVSDGSMNSTSMDMMMHMSFYWGKDVIVWFSGWPERSVGMYILALCFVFLLGFAVEILSVSPVQLGGGWNPMISLLIQACVYVVRMGFAYMLMLSVMTYNLGVFIVAVAGHGAGFLLVKARALAAANKAQSADPASATLPRVNSKV